MYNRRDAKTFLSHGLSHNTTNNRFYRVAVLKTRRTRGTALGFVVVNSVDAFGVGARQNWPRRDRYEPALVPMACTAGEVDFLKSRAEEILCSLNSCRLPCGTTITTILEYRTCTHVRGKKREKARKREGEKWHAEARSFDSAI